MGFKKLNATIEGRVQGVGFRFFCQRTATLIGVTGWVKNQLSGNVELEAIGTEERVKEYLLVIKKGPSMSEVIDVDYTISDSDYNEYSTFEIVD